MIEFQKEVLNDSFFAEIKPLIDTHYKEIAHFQDIPLEPDYDLYQKLNDEGAMRVYTARDEEKKLIGYALFFVKFNLHYKSSKQAVQDILFIAPEKRGFGAIFISWCDDQLKAEGVEAVYHHTKTKFNFGSLLEKQGYEHVENIYVKRLN